MGLPTITRAVGWRDDFLATTAWTIQDSSGRSVTTLTTDGDLGLLQTVFTSAVANDQGQIYHSGLSLSTTTYPKIIIRHSDAGNLGTNPVGQVKTSYSDTTSDTFQLLSTATLTAETFTMTAGKTLTQVNVQFNVTANFSGTVKITIDFVYPFKETLTLPTASKAVRQRTKRRIIAIPIWGKEGDVLQDGGSDSPEYDIAGQLVSTTSGQSGWTNTYTADQWWGLLNGLQLETGTAQADGNMTWQWFTFDEGSAKVVIVALVPDENPGRVQNFDYSLQLKQFDILGRTFANPVGGILATY
jgi:hypothetical protein